jgi:DNA replication and repair protein RecF
MSAPAAVPSVRINRVRLFQFRCHPETVLHPRPGRNALSGANGTGKTSVLEAVYFAARLRSFRTHQSRELVQWDKADFRVEVDFETDQSQQLVVTWRRGVREMERNGQTVARARDYWGRLPIVLFSPQDQALVTGPGGERRAWMDALLAQLDPEYLVLAQDYQRWLRQRNAWWKQGARDRRTGEILRDQLTACGLQVTQRRAALSLAVGLEWSRVFQEAFPGEHAPEWKYEPSFPLESGPDWEKVRAREEALQTTLLGPHRDDWTLQHAAHGLNRFGSEGQQRLAALCLRVAETRLLEKKLGRTPVLLIDDVTPALDARRRQAFEAMLPTGAQALITSPEPAENPGVFPLWGQK